MTWYFKKQLNLALCFVNFFLYTVLEHYTPENNVRYSHVVVAVLCFVGFMVCREKAKKERIKNEKK